MKDYKLAEKELIQFEEAFKKAEDVGIEVEWFSAFMESIYYQSYEKAEIDRDLSRIIEKTNKKLGM